MSSMDDNERGEGFRIHGRAIELPDNLSEAIAQALAGTPVPR